MHTYIHRTCSKRVTDIYKCICDAYVTSHYLHMHVYVCMYMCVCVHTERTYICVIRAFYHVEQSRCNIVVAVPKAVVQPSSIIRKCFLNVHVHICTLHMSMYTYMCVHVHICTLYILCTLICVHVNICTLYILCTLICVHVHICTLYILCTLICVYMYTFYMSMWTM
jgi:hypothetical protein